MMRRLRETIDAACRESGVECRKSTGDGYLLTFAHAATAVEAAIGAVECSFKVLDLVGKQNSSVPGEERIHLRFAIHFGEIDVLDNDCEGPNVSYAFRLEKFDIGILGDAHQRSVELPKSDYVLCSERVSHILEEHGSRHWAADKIGVTKFRGFDNLHEVYLVRPAGSRNDAVDGVESMLSMIPDELVPPQKRRNTDHIIRVIQHLSTYQLIGQRRRLRVPIQRYEPSDDGRYKNIPRLRSVPVPNTRTGLSAMVFAYFFPANEQDRTRIQNVVPGTTRELDGMITRCDIDVVPEGTCLMIDLANCQLR
jgi:class 3 adenylate cyclase